jgi:SAM-dependent methyltransferase
MQQQPETLQVSPQISQRWWSNLFKSSSLSLIWMESLLIATPLLVICFTVLFNPGNGKGFVSTVISKPEWYFIALVFSIEALRDRLRIKDFKQAERDADEPYVLLALIFILVAAVLAALATLAALGLPAEHTVPTSYVMQNGSEDLNLGAAAIAVQQPPMKSTNISLLQYLAIPIFLMCAVWSARSKVAWKREEHRDLEQRSLLVEVGAPRMYNVEKTGRAKAFYDAVAAVYNERNDKTKGIRSAHNVIVQSILCIPRTPTSGISVLDIGAGSGYNVYNSLRNDSGIDWTAFDVSPKMIQKFQQDFPQVTAIVGDCLSPDLENLGMDKKFDVIVLSFALSSMRKSIDFDCLARLLKPSGFVLVADIHPGYVAKSPSFDIKVGRDTHALKLRKVDPLMLEEEAKVKFSRAKWQLFSNERGEIYSYFLHFQMIVASPTQSKSSA